MSTIDNLEVDFKNENGLKNKDDLNNEDDLKNEEDLKTVYWRSTHGAEHISPCASNTTFVVLVFKHPVALLFCLFIWVEQFSTPVVTSSENMSLITSIDCWQNSTKFWWNVTLYKTKFMIFIRLERFHNIWTVWIMVFTMSALQVAAVIKTRFLCEQHS